MLNMARKNDETKGSLKHSDFSILTRGYIDHSSRSPISKDGTSGYSSDSENSSALLVGAPFYFGAESLMAAVKLFNDRTCSMYKCPATAINI